MNVDVLLVLEGTYPFVAGGVSTWVHQLVAGMPELRFGIIFVGGARAAYGGPRYALPENVVHLESHFLDDPPPRAPLAHADLGRAERAAVERMHASLREAGGDTAARTELGGALRDALARVAARPEAHEGAFLRGDRAWERACDGYARTCPGASFVDYFWTLRSMHAPLFAMARIAKSAPRARVVHVVSTGYAGICGAMIAEAQGAPLLVTEHGIYAKERRIELLTAGWLGDAGGQAATQEHPLRATWIRFFEALARATYASARVIVSLFEENRARQLDDGADPARARVIANGVDVERFGRLARARPARVPPVAALVGRVVPIKDVKTFVRAMKVVCDEIDGAEGWVVGPDDEDPAYAAQCRELVASLGLSGRVRLLGRRDVADVYPAIGVNVLTSISEGQPLVLLEGLAAGVPAVATDVGDCRGILHGRDALDRAEGRAGEIVALANPAATAAAVVGLLRDPLRWREAQAVGLRRVARRYTADALLARYRGLYGDLAASGADAEVA